MTTERIVTSQMGSWKWQDAYRIATYEAAAGKDGKLRWWSVGRSGKWSQPQLKKQGYWDSIPYGSLHRKELSVEEAAQWRMDRMSQLGVI